MKLDQDEVQHCTFAGNGTVSFARFVDDDLRLLALLNGRVDLRRGSLSHTKENASKRQANVVGDV